MTALEQHIMTCEVCQTESCAFGDALYAADLHATGRNALEAFRDRFYAMMFWQP